MKFFVICLLALSCCSCSFFKKNTDNQDVLNKEKAEEEAPVEKYRTVGRVASVNLSDKFVLIQQYSNQKLEQGSTLTSYGIAGKRANLHVSGEKMGLFSVADIRSGDVAVGDPVQVLIIVPQRVEAEVKGQGNGVIPKAEESASLN